MKLIHNKRNPNIYAFNISSNSSTKPKKTKGFSFKALTGNFYEDLINSDISIKRDKIKLSHIKNKTIKESIYSNRDIPKSWKTLLGYTDEVYKAIDKDPNFAYYLGANNKDTLSNNFFGTQLKNIDSDYKAEKNKKFISIENIDKYIKDNNIDNNNDNKKDELTENNEKKNEIKKYNKTISYIEKNHPDNKNIYNIHHYQREFKNNNHFMNDKFFSSKLDEYRNKYDIDKFVGSIKHKIREIQIDDDDDDIYYYLKMKKENKKNYYREFLKDKTQNNKKKVLTKTIYSNLIPEKGEDKNFYRTFNNNKGLMPLNKIKRKKYNPLKTTPLFYNTEKNLKENSMNKKIKRDLELINYFGPHNSNCLVCKKRNMDFYTNSEPKQTMILLNYLKKIKLNDEHTKYIRRNKE